MPQQTFLTMATVYHRVEADPHPTNASTLISSLWLPLDGPSLH